MDIWTDAIFFVLFCFKYSNLSYSYRDRCKIVKTYSIVIINQHTFPTFLLFLVIGAAVHAASNEMFEIFLSLNFVPHGYVRVCT